MFRFHECSHTYRNKSKCKIKTETKIHKRKDGQTILQETPLTKEFSTVTK